MVVYWIVFAGKSTLCLSKKLLLDAFDISLNCLNLVFFFFELQKIIVLTWLRNGACGINI